MNIVHTFVYFFKRKILQGFRIHKNELVIDIGSGDKPFWRGDVFFDNLDLKDNQRISGTGTVHNLGLFVNGDILHSPFKDKIFDFSFCSHTLEHVERPDLAIKEIMRISKRGYIESPTGILETLVPFHSHLWFVYAQNNKLIFIRKSKNTHTVLLQNQLVNKEFSAKISDPFIRYYWENSIEYEIYNDLKKGTEFYPSKKETINDSKKNYYLLFIIMLRNIFYKNKRIDKKDILKK